MNTNHNLEYVIRHVFCPLRLPGEDDHSLSGEQALVGAVVAAAHAFTNVASGTIQSEWLTIVDMLKKLGVTVQIERLRQSYVASQLSSMQPGGVCAFLIRAQNAGVVFKKELDWTVYSAFEVSPQANSVITTQGKLICSYPGPAIEIPNAVFDDAVFQSQLTNFLVRMNEDVLDDSTGKLLMERPAFQRRDTIDPQNITELLTGILRGVGRPAMGVVRITKRIGDDVIVSNGLLLPWRRSSLWLLIRVVLQTTLEPSPRGRDSYKAFMIFFLTRLAEDAIQADMSNDLLHVVSAKISRRLRKFSTFAPEWLSEAALEACGHIRTVLDARWEQVQAAQRASPPHPFSQLDLVRDAQLSLQCSRKFLGDRFLDHDHVPPVPFHPNHRPRASLDDFLSSNIFADAFHAESHVTLYDVEQAVEQGIDAWIGGVTNADQACVQLETLAKNYSLRALKTYADNPEQLSVMFLTSLELWVALDEIATRNIPMLMEFSPEIPIILLEKLLFCKASHLRRLRHVYKYLHHRHSQSHPGSSVFSLEVSEEMFAVRYYNESVALKGLKDQIKEDAEREVQKKIAELKEANCQHAKLKLEIGGIPHTHVTGQDGTEYHASNCHKCELETQLNGMEMDVYEWPLPDDELRAAVVIFELACPVAFNMWRATTFHFLVDICSQCSRGKRPYLLRDYPGLQSYFIEHPRSRITLASSTTPINHKQLSIPAEKEQVSVSNSLRFYGFDHQANIPVANALSGIKIERYCTHKIQEGPYQNLQRYVDATLHTSNEVLAGQADCHNDLSIHEFIAFGHLRSSGALQWLNILRELRDRSLSFRCTEVHSLLAQATMQVGLLSKTGKPMWHAELQEVSFGFALTNELETLVVDVEGNWLEGVTMDTVSFLLGRLLAAQPDEAVSQRALMLLRSVRRKVYAWVQELLDKLIRTPGDEELRGLLRDTAAICRSTFNVEPDLIPEVLCSAEDVEVFVACAIVLHDNTPSEVSSFSTYSQLLLDRDRRLSMALESSLSDVIQADAGDRGINLAVCTVWPDYRPSSKWTPLPGSDSRWFSCTTASTTSQCSQVVHFNLLDGSLLVDGKPLGRLPSAIVQHFLYNNIFGKQVLDVIPGDLPGMDYSTRGTISDHQVSFALRGRDLVIQAKRTATGGSDIIELIPPGKLENDIPAVLIKGHVHWLNLSTSVMEIRPFGKPWEASPENWNIDCTPGQYRMYKGHELLVDVRSQSWAMMSDLLKPLDTPQNLLVTMTPNDPDQPSSSPQLSVSLPRYGLSFYVDEDGDLQSHNIRGMVYDENQSLGTLFGLVNRLVLRPKIRECVDADELVPRCVLIPEGPISFRMDGHHVRIEIDTRGPALQRVTCQTYRIDTDLGCLTGTVSLTNKLYRAYLHALTSGGCSVDPLTGRSGTEEALGLLRSASCWSIMKFDSRDAELLRSIASLCPARSLHSRYKNIQIVQWLNLPILSQSEQLYLTAKAIKDHFERVQLFHEGWETAPLEKFPSHNDHLIARSLLRAAYLLPSETPEQLSRADSDVVYTARDVLETNSAEHRTYLAAASVFGWSLDTIAIAVTDIMSLVNLQEGTMSSDTPLSLTYHSSWLKPHLSTIWIKAYNLLRCSEKACDRFKLLFSLSAMAYGSPKLCDTIPTLLAFALHPPFRLEDPPAQSDYNLSDGYRPTRKTISPCVLDSAHKFPLSPESSAPTRSSDKTSRAQKRYQCKLYNTRLERDMDTVTAQVLGAWPSQNPPSLSLNANAYNVWSLKSSIRDLIRSCHRNTSLQEHLDRVQTILRALAAHPHTLPVSSPSYEFEPAPSLNMRFRTSWSITLDQLIFTRAAPLLPSRNQFPHFTTEVERTSSFSGAHQLHQLISATQGNPTDDTFQCQYTSDLRSSVVHFCNEVSPAPQVLMEEPSDEGISLLVDYYVLSRTSYLHGLNLLREVLGPSNKIDELFEQSGQWPRITPEALLRCIASTSPIKLTEPWKRYLVRLALLLLELQRARRLLRLALDGLHEDFYKEFDNGGWDGWDPEAQPDWILIQLQGNFLVRHVQVDVANEMVSPHSGANTAMQLNMGEGKSSVIVPISVAKLANGDQLSRVIVPKALTAQMFQLLVDRLGGLTNRRIYYLPFSRSLPLDSERVTTLHALMSECMRERGILVVQPDHVLSLKLVSVEKQLANDASVARPLLELQKWLHLHARDILDESDEILHVRYQLVYTIGLQQHMEGFPERWTTTQQILGIVKKHTPSLRTTFNESVEYEAGPPGSFPHIRILQPDAGEALISQIARDAIDGFLPNFNFQRLNGQLRDAVFAFITKKDVSPSTCKLVEGYFRQTTLWGGILLLRGILATDILLFSFRDQRWRVDYGLAPKRTMLAVPYRAKDVPAPKAEFGHPDVAILLTCLSYYYGGLTEEQLKVSFELLLKQDDPSLDYEHWVQDCLSVPGSLRNYTGINLKSSEQWSTLLVPLFSRNHTTVDFFLARVVFPKEAKEFPSKLACSGWDLAEKKEHLLTGFSGTNDGRYLLPLHITQRDPDHQRGTNAKVLTYLLQPENKHYTCMTKENGERRTTVEFLEILVAQRPEIRVLLDVGAQMLDLENRKLAEAWLAFSTDTSAAIYFNEDDELTVLTRDGSTQLLLSSPFAQQLDQCVIYLDDAHTRGTDIKFPTGFRAAVTLGPKVTKDRLAQGCMRMRKLGTGHSVMFFAPLEVEWKIRGLSAKDSEDDIHTIDILRWVIQETCHDIQQRAPHWAQQGLNHQARYNAWSKFCANELTPEKLSTEWLQPEVKSLEELYAPQSSMNTTAFTVPEIRDRCISLGITSLHTEGMDEEQEREVVHEVEREREVERPPKASPAQHSLTKGLVSFVKTGAISNQSAGFHAIFTTLDNTSAVTNESRVWNHWVLATDDFCRTIVPSEGGTSSKIDNYLRPVQWIISSKTAVKHILVVLSPYEINQLLPLIRKSKNIHLHLYTPRITKSMKPSDDLSLYSIPEVSLDWIPPQALMTQLNLFAGQLFLSNRAAYVQLCRFLCIYSPDLQDIGKEGTFVEYDGFIRFENRRGVLGARARHTFQNTPLPFVRVLLGLRRKGMSFAETHMGRLLKGRLLTDRDFERREDRMDDE